MDIQAIIDKVVGEVQQAPEMLQEIVADPGAAIEKITGHSLGDTDIAAVACLLYTSPSPRDKRQSRMPSSA